MRTARDENVWVVLSPAGAPAKGKPNTSRGLRGNQDGDAVGCWHTAAVTYRRLRAPAAVQCFNTISSHQHWSQTKELATSWHRDPLY
jgi:hypothetical protein